MQFSGKTAVVTGAASGIGRATALAFGNEGANVALFDIDADGAKEVAQRIDPTGERTMVYPVDMARPADIRAALQAVNTHFGHLDAVANVAAIYPHASVSEVTEEFWDRMIAIDLKGVFFCCQEALRIMAAQGNGAIVNVASSIAFQPNPNLAPYAAAKGGIVAMTRVLALEYARSGVRINVLSPGHTASEQAVGNVANMEAIAATLVSGRWMAPEEQANAILWLCSDAASGCHGAIINVTGGIYMP